jgi:hypothetical protein
MVREGTEPVYVFEICGRDGVHLVKIDGIIGDVLNKPIAPAPASVPPR